MSIVRTKNTRLGLKLGSRANSNDASLGWCLVERGQPKAAGNYVRGDVLELARGAARIQKGPLTIYVYGSDDSFAESQAKKDGLTRSAHAEMIEFIAAQLDKEGHDIVVCEV